MVAQLETPQDDTISLTLAKFEPNELIQVIEGLKKIIETNPEQGKSMLEANKDLTYAILQAEFLMGLVDEKVLSEVSKTVNINATQSNVNTEGAQLAAQPQEPVAPPAAPAPAPAAPAETAPVKKSLADLDPQQAEIVKQALAIPEDQLAMFPPEYQTMVRTLKAEYL